jgi:hypothetical protein
MGVLVESFKQIENNQINRKQEESLGLALTAMPTCLHL